jgi:hypothetical protein
MIQTEQYRVREDGVRLIRTYSDDRRLIRKVGTTEVYSEAIDVEDAGYTYEETNRFIDENDDD